MRRHLFYLLIIILLVGCNNRENNIATKYLNSDNLSSQTFKIDSKIDNVLTTADGIRIIIEKNSIESKSEFVTLQIKEAITIEEMLIAGLTTNSDKGLLTSDGMFFISTIEPSTIKKAIKINVPALYADEKMKLYKAEQTGNKILWKDPVPLDKPLTAFTDTGKLLFETNCASCHRPNTEVTGPALAWIDKRRPKKWLYNFTHNVSAILGERDQYACCIYNKYSRTPMNTFTHLKDEELDALYNYVDKEAKRLGIPENFNPNADCDSCEYYHNYFYTLSKKRDSLIANNGSMAKITVVEPPDTDPNADNGTVPTKIDPQKFKAEYYQLSIEAYGWYNIDDLVKGRFNSIECELTVQVESEQTQKFNVFLILPKYKVFNEGGLLENGEEYGFYTIDGKIYLPQKAKAFVIAIGEEGGKLFFGSTKFITSASEKIKIKVSESTKEKMHGFLKSINAKDIDLKVDKTKNFDGISEVDKEIQRIYDKVKNCECNFNDTSTMPVTFPK